MPKDYTGLKCGKLTAISDTGKSNNYHNRIWLFQCECGATVERTALSVISSVAAGNIPACRSCAIKHKRQFGSKDYTGQVFGKLTAISDTGKSARHSQIWMFQCECGAMVERTVRNVTNSLSQGNVPMCARCRSKRTAVRRDITGQKFGKLTALSPTNELDHRAVVWEFQCECGRIVKTANLRKNSCGKRPCNPIAPLPGNEGAFNDLYRDYRDGARKRGIVFELTQSRARELFEQNCFYCNAEPSYVKKGVQPFIFNGIDRLHNHLGYIEGNVVACCGVCNRAKSDLSYNEFMAWIDRIIKRRISMESLYE